MIAHPGLPQIRTCRITASGSSGSKFASTTTYGVDGDAVRQAIAFAEPVEPVPWRAVLAVTTGQPLVPDILHLVMEPIQGNTVARDSVVGVMPLQFPAQYGVLFGDRAVPVVAAPMGNLPDRPGKAALHGLTFHHPVAPPGTTPVVREA